MLKERVSRRGIAARKVIYTYIYIYIFTYIYIGIHIYIYVHTDVLPNGHWAGCELQKAASPACNAIEFSAREHSAPRFHGISCIFFSSMEFASSELSAISNQIPIHIITAWHCISGCMSSTLSLQLPTPHFKRNDPNLPFLQENPLLLPQTAGQVGKNTPCPPVPPLFGQQSCSTSPSCQPVQLSPFSIRTGKEICAFGVLNPNGYGAAWAVPPLPIAAQLFE